MYVDTHLERVSIYTGLLAGHLRLSERRISDLQFAAFHHDDGKSFISDDVWCKRGPLTPLERTEVDMHARFGYIMLGIDAASNGHQRLTRRMRYATQVALMHHERFDGSGVPLGLIGYEIPLAARIVGLCDTYDALRSARSYKPAIPHEEVLRMLLVGEGNLWPEQWDPKLLDILVDNEMDFSEVSQPDMSDLENI